MLLTSELSPQPHEHVLKGTKIQRKEKIQLPTLVDTLIAYKYKISSRKIKNLTRVGRQKM